LKPEERNRSDFSFGRIRTFSSLQNPVYRLFFLGMIGQFASMNMQMMTTSLLLYRLTDSAALLGVMSLVMAVPMLCLSLFGGAIAAGLMAEAAGVQLVVGGFALVLTVLSILTIIFIARIRQLN
jgi:hypothetical protein